MTKENNGLSNQIIKGGFWIAVLEVSNQVLQFIKTFYAAKILTPKDFGVVGFAFLIIAFIDILSTTGMKEAIIQKKNYNNTHLDSAWLIEITKGTIVLLLTLFLAPIVTDILRPENPLLTTKIIRFIGGIYFVQCTTSIGVIQFEKDIQFKKYFWYQFSGTLADVIVSMSFVYYLESVWGLFYGILAGQIVRVLFSYLLTDYRPRINFSRTSAKELFRYGKWVFAGRVYNFLGLQADSIIVSSFFSLYALGIYQMAFRIGNLPMSQVSNIIGRLAFPTFSKIQDDQDKLKSFFLLSLNILCVALIPLVLLVFCFIGEFTDLFLGAKWLEIVPVVQILILSGFLRIFVSIVDSFFSAIGQPRYSSRLQLVRFIVFLVVVPALGYFFGTVGVASSGLISIAFVLVIFLYHACTRMKIVLSDIFVNLLIPLIFGSLISVLLYMMKATLYQGTVMSFLVMIVLSIFIYFGAGFLVTRYTRIKIFGKTIELLTSYRRILS